MKSDENQSGTADARRTWLTALGVSLATALAIVSPFFWLGSASGHDFGFHAASWIDVAGQWREGIVYPRWTEWANYGFGEPRFIFYPPLSWMLGAALGFLAPWRAVPGLFVVVAQTIAGLSAFSLAKRFTTRRGALFAAACYAANPYALVVIYMRSDFAEQLAAAFFPLLLLMAMGLAGAPRGRKARRQVGWFALVFAAVWLSNAPAGVMASYSMALVFTWLAFRQKSWEPLARGACGLALGLGLTAFYLVPAAYEQAWVNIAQALSSGLQPAENFLYTQINDPEHNLFNWIVSSAAMLLTVLTGIAAIAARRTDARREDSDEVLWQAMLLLAAAATLLMFHPTIILWRFLPKLRFVQFPWRWMSILAVAYAYFLGAGLVRQRRAWLWFAGVTAISVGAAVFLVQHAWWDSEDIPVLKAAIRQDAGFDGTDEYDPLGDDHYSLPEKEPRWEVLGTTSKETAVPSATVEMKRWIADDRELRITTNQPIRLAVRLLNYPAWQIEVNGIRAKSTRAEEFNQMIVALPGGQSRLRIHFGRTPDRVIGGALSLGSLLLLASVFWTGRSKGT
jgi:hypothetical protein